MEQRHQQVEQRHQQVEQSKLLFER
jgi:hypothetical protein